MAGRVTDATVPYCRISDIKVSLYLSRYNAGLCIYELLLNDINQYVIISLADIILVL